MTDIQTKTRVKICGLTQMEDAIFAAEQGADMLGFIFAPMSKRYIEPATARLIIDQIKRRADAPVCVGVFVTQGTTTSEIMLHARTARVDAAQIVGLNGVHWLKGLGVPAYGCIRPESAEQAQIEAEQFELKDLPENLPTLQLDAFHPTLYGGTGETATEAVMLALSQKVQRLMLAGGLTPDNVAGYVTKIHPWAVDVASGTEMSPGRKDRAKVKDFIQAVKEIV